MKEIIIGMDGFIGRSLCAHLPDAVRTTRRNAALDQPGTIHFDMTRPSVLPQADIVYLCAGVNGNLTCSIEPRHAYRVNVDGTIWVAEHCAERGAFLVWVSSTTVMWLSEHYGRQKRIAENHLRMMPNVGIVRAGRVLSTNVDDLCRLMIRVGRERDRGVALWNEDEAPYQH